MDSHHLSYLEQSRDGPGVAHVQDAVPGRPGGGGGGRDDGVRHVAGKQHEKLDVNKLNCGDSPTVTARLSARHTPSRFTGYTQRLPEKHFRIKAAVTRCGGCCELI